MKDDLLFSMNMEALSVKELVENSPDDSDNIYYRLGRMHVYEEVYKKLYGDIPEPTLKNMTHASMMVYDWQKARRT